MRTLALLLLTGFLGACDRAPADAVAPELSRDEQLSQLRQGLTAAHRAWSAGTYDVAREGVLTVYEEHFAALEPALRAADPRGTLELEYRFGALAAQLGRRGNPVEVATAVRDHVARLEAAVAALPAEPAGPLVVEEDDPKSDPG